MYGPYEDKNNGGRRIVILNGKTISYPKLLYETHFNVRIEEPYTIDHHDDDFRNDSIENLKVLTRAENAKKSAIGNKHCLGKTISLERRKNLSGSKNPASKLSEEEVEEYRKQYFALPFKKDRVKLKNKIIEKKGLCRRTVENFLQGVSYGGVDETGRHCRLKSGRP